MMDNLKILPETKPNVKRVNMKLVHVKDGNGIAIKVDDFYEYWLVRVENQEDGSVMLKLWRGDIGPNYSLMKQNDECSGDSIVYKLEKVNY